MTIETLVDRWEQGRISIAMLRVYVKKGVITADDFKSITGQEY